MPKRKILRAVLAALLLLELAAIFQLSHEPAAQSDLTSAAFTSQMLAADSDYLAASQAERDARVQSMQKGVRTLAHLSEYILLGLTAAAFALTFDRSLRGALLAAGGCVLWAVGDEIHQYFVPGRSCQLADVAVDSFGALLGAAIAWGLLRLGTALLKKRKDDSHE
ncbi:MAG: VanZ family protein [Clostridia bacterium]|nr:VanZ family protein [Clostridia bacterium]